MSTGIHRNQVVGEIHIAHSFEYADSAARIGAVGLIPADVGRVARQLDNETFWLLKDDSPIAWIQIGGGIGDSLTHKAGKTLAGSFSGSPKSATVTFTTPFSDTNFVAILTPVTTGNKTYSPAVMDVTASGFKIMLGSGSINGLVHVGWVTVGVGESG